MKLQEVLSVNNLSYKVILFDDYVLEDEGNSWTYVCNECKEKYRITVSDKVDLEIYCGVANCYNFASHYMNLKGDVKR